MTGNWTMEQNTEKHQLKFASTMQNIANRTRVTKILIQNTPTDNFTEVSNAQNKSNSLKSSTKIRRDETQEVVSLTFCRLQLETSCMTSGEVTGLESTENAMSLQKNEIYSF